MSEELIFPRKQNTESDSDVQNIVIKLWELIRNASESINDLKSKYRDLETKYRSAERSLIERNNYHEKSEQKLNSLEKKVEELNSQLFAKDNHIQILSQKADEINRLKAELNESKAQIEQLRQKNALLKEKSAFVPKLTEDLESERIKNKHNELKIIELQGKVKELTSLNASFSIVQKELAHKNLVIKEKSEKIDELKEQLELNKSIAIKLKNIESERDLHRAKLNETEAEYNMLKKRQSEDLQLLNDELEYKNHLLKQANEQLSNAETNIEKLHNSLNEKEQLVNKLNDALSISESKIFGLQQTAKIQITEINKYKIKNAELVKNLEKLREVESTINIKDKQIAELTHKNDETIAALSLLQKERDRLKRFNQTMTDDLDKARASVNENIDLIDELTRELEITKGQLYELQNAQSANSTTAYEAKIEELKQIISKMSEQIIHAGLLEKKLIESDEKLNRLTNEITIKDIGLTQAREKIDDFEGLLKKRYEQIKILETELNSLYEKNYTQKAKYSTLSEKIDRYIIQIDEILKNN